ncbi:hypothetical protein SAMN05444397_101236 [Flavobacterium aquidurense]|uniref:Collagen-like protein n=1 Tax=Flavobacterium frigidimaris TaxID=262320 RepID=A0ABX4BPZ1_FLAFR|nr:hypothetical protein [Flavobacterium frigidimaris]OXA78311.1 hypothetical protein B0A65_13835 [Flavobacterium frigidimaris]SDY28248.1 hypothetical protein SAMN05444397_101236 [Flavobacterium aquidurense]
MKKILTLFALVGLIVFSSCEGPEGPPGQDGLLAEAFEIKNVNLTRITNTHYEYANNFKPFVGGNLFDDETVLIYRLTDLTNSGAPVWQLIPKTTNYDNGDVADYFFDFSKEDFVISVIASFNLATQTDLINNQTYRVVIIPSALAKSVTNKNNYLEVMNTLKLNESEIKTVKF